MKRHSPLPRQTRLRSSRRTERTIENRANLSTGVEPGKADTRKSIETVIQSKIELAQQKSAAAARVTRSSYQFESRRPWVCLLFVLPMILAYEFATLIQGEHLLRSGVDQWLDQFFRSFGFGQLVLLPVITAGILIAWHHQLDDHWRVRVSVFGGMIIETIGLGLMMYWTAKAFYLLSQSEGVAAIPALTPTESSAAWWSNTIAMLGSGIYEELFFRLILLAPTIYFASRWTPSGLGHWIGIAVVSLLFAALHYDFINPAGASFEPTSFFFRFGASVIFSVLFLYRGFGIAVGTHVAFDILTQF